MYAERQAVVSSFVDDMVGAFIPRGRRPLLDSALERQRVAREGDPESLMVAAWPQPREQWEDAGVEAVIGNGPDERRRRGPGDVAVDAGFGVVEGLGAEGGFEGEAGEELVVRGDLEGGRPGGHRLLPVGQGQVVEGEHRAQGVTVGPDVAGEGERVGERAERDATGDRPWPGAAPSATRATRRW